jgi:hypothetical protein
MLSDVSASTDRVIGEFDALAVEPALRDVSAEIGQVQLSLRNLRGALQAQVEAGGSTQSCSGRVSPISTVPCSRSGNACRRRRRESRTGVSQGPA